MEKAKKWPNRRPPGQALNFWIDPFDHANPRRYQPAGQAPDHPHIHPPPGMFPPCVFCNQRPLPARPPRIPSVDQIQREVNRFLKYGKKRPATTQISFFGGSFLGLEKRPSDTAGNGGASFVRAKDVDSIRFSTRPDTVSQENPGLLDGFPVSTVELGCSVHERPGSHAAGRGHRAADTVAATVC
jgi:hypothetical protein